MQVLFGHKGYGVMTLYFALIGSDIVFSVESRRSAFFPSVRGADHSQVGALRLWHPQTVPTTYAEESIDPS
jgi:hypothetical protein